MNSGNEEPSILNFQGFTLSRTPPIQLVTPCGLKSFPSKVKSSEFQEAKNFLGGKKFDKLKTQTKNIQTRLKLQKGDFKNEQKGGCGTHYKKNKVRDDYCTNYYKLLQTRVNHNMSRSPSKLDCWGHPYPQQGEKNQKSCRFQRVWKNLIMFSLSPPPQKKWKLKGWRKLPKEAGKRGEVWKTLEDPSLPFSFQRREKSANPPRVSRLHCDRTKPKRLGGGGGGGGVISFSYGIFLAQKHHGELDKNVHFGPSSRWKSGLKLGNLTIFTWMYAHLRMEKHPNEKHPVKLRQWQCFRIIYVFQDCYYSQAQKKLQFNLYDEIGWYDCLISALIIY